MKRLSGECICAVIKVENLEQVFSDIDNWLAAAEAQIEGIARGLATEALINLLDHSPQYSGDFAANWKVSVNVPDHSFEAGIFGKTFAVKGSGSPFIRGDMPALQYAMRNAMGKLDGFKLGDTIWISNSAKHLELYAWKIENNKIKFRPGNYGEAIRITMDEMRTRYTEISRADAEQLIREKL